MEGRRWPVVTFALIALNILVFLGTHWKIEEQQPERIEVRTRILVLAATHPDLKMPADVEKFVNEVKSKAPEEAWKKLASRSRKPGGSWDTQIPEGDDSEQLQADMDSLAQRFAEVQKSSIMENYAFVRAHPNPISYITSMFLHIGWIHLIGNMWFLWLAGFILEDRWGRAIYPIFYLLAGVAASLFHVMFNLHSLAPTLGASGAVAALMGGFLIVQGTEFLEQGKFDEGIAVLKKHIAAKPEAIDAYSLLRQLYWRKNDIAAYLEATIKLCQLHFKAHDADAAWEDFNDYCNAGGDRMPAPTWLELCRMAEGKQDFERAVKEYEHLAKAYPTERQALLALLAAGRLALKQLHRPSDALLYYKAAKASSVPHVDWESNIQAGIQNAELALSGSYASTTKS